MPVPDRYPESIPNSPQEAAENIRRASHRPKDITVRFPADVWRNLVAAFSDAPDLAAEIVRLRTELANSSLSRANLAAAALATINAHSDGEPDPLFYLRDELRAQGYAVDGGAR
jgi:hypothetical protein